MLDIIFNRYAGRSRAKSEGWLAVRQKQDYILVAHRVTLVGLRIRDHSECLEERCLVIGGQLDFNSLNLFFENVHAVRQLIPALALVVNLCTEHSGCTEARCSTYGQTRWLWEGGGAKRLVP